MPNTSKEKAQARAELACREMARLAAQGKRGSQEYWAANAQAVQAEKAARNAPRT